MADNADNYKSDDIHGLVVALKDAGQLHLLATQLYSDRYRYYPAGVTYAVIAIH